MKNKKETPTTYSIIIELDEMYEDFSSFLNDIHELFLSRQKPFEILIILNGVNELIRENLDPFILGSNNVRAFGFLRKTPQAVCIKTAFKASNGEIIIVCGPYAQITKESFIKLLDSFDDNTDMISPLRQKRVDSRYNQFQARIFNRLVGALTKTNFHDLNCGVRVFRREVLEEINLYGNMYRFLPILAERRGFKVKEVECVHLEKRGPSSFYSIPFYFTLLIDIFTLFFNVGFTKKPLRFFSAIGAFFSSIGMLLMLYVSIRKFFFGIPIGGSLTLFFAILFTVLGIQVATVGLLGEIIAFVHGRHRKEYAIEKII
jgi:hypothetical protein